MANLKRELAEVQKARGEMLARQEKERKVAAEEAKRMLAGLQERSDDLAKQLAA